MTCVCFFQLLFFLLREIIPILVHRGYIFAHCDLWIWALLEPTTLATPFRRLEHFGSLWSLGLDFTKKHQMWKYPFSHIRGSGKCPRWVSFQFWGNFSLPWLWEEGFTRPQRQKGVCFAICSGMSTTNSREILLSKLRLVQDCPEIRLGSSITSLCYEASSTWLFCGLWSGAIRAFCKQPAARSV